MINNLIDKIKKLANESIKFPPENSKELQNFLVAWWCNKYNIPMTSKEAQELQFEMLIFEFYLVKRWEEIQTNIKEGKYHSEQQEVEDEEWLKEQMGEEYHNETDYYAKPSTQEKAPPDIEENFECLGNIKEYEED